MFMAAFAKPLLCAGRFISTKFNLKTMTDIEVFKKFMGWMQMEVSKEKQLENGNTVMVFSDPNKNTELFTKSGYDEFYAGIVFDKDGNMVKGYIDSHVAYTSANCDLMDKM